MDWIESALHAIYFLPYVLIVLLAVFGYRL
jgi:hypothetical protein